MSTSAQNQSIENVSIPDVLNAGIPAIIQNIRPRNAALVVMTSQHVF